MHHAFALALLLLAAPASAGTIVLDFEAETPGSYEPGYASVCSCAVFWTFDSVHVSDFGVQSIGRAIAASAEDSDLGLVIDFSGPISALSLAFGNDDPNILDTTDEAILEAFLSGVKVGEARVFVNANDVMDQTIALSGVGTLDRAIFTYTGSIDEVIDNLVLTTVPEPRILGLALIALTTFLGRSGADTAGRRSRA